MTSDAVVSLEAMQKRAVGYVEPANWPEPDFSVLTPRREVPRFPLDLLPDDWANWVANAADSTSAPPDYVALPLLTSAAALIGNSRCVKLRAGWSEPCILWGAMIGAPSAGKTPGSRAVLAQVKRIEAGLAEDHKEALADWERASEVAKAARASWESEVKEAQGAGRQAPPIPAEATAPDRPPFPSIVLNDATQEAIQRIQASEPRGVLVHRDELAGWAAKLDASSGTGGERAFYIEAYNAGPYRADRVKLGGTPISIDRLSVSMLGGVQPDRLADLIGGKDDGLASRFLYCWPRPVEGIWEAPELESEWAEAALARLHRLNMPRDETGAPFPSVVPLCREAGAAYGEWWKSAKRESESAGGLMAGHLGKMLGVAGRLALVWEFLHWSQRDGAAEPETVSEKAALSAIALVDEYFRPHAQAAFGDAARPREERDAAAIARAILKREARLVNKREMRREWGLEGLSDSKCLSLALEQLEQAGWLREPELANAPPGRRAGDFLVNPMVLETRGDA